MESTSLVLLIGSQAAIVSTVVGLVAITKRLAGNAMFLRIYPPWLYAVLYALGLTWASHHFGYLVGNLPDLLVQSVFLAASASGFRDWMTRGNLTKGLEDTTPARLARTGINWEDGQ